MIWSTLLATLTGATPPVPTVAIERIATPIPVPAAVSAAHRFGISVALEGERLAIGADGRRDGPADPGIVTVFRRAIDPGPAWRLKEAPFEALAAVTTPHGDGST